MRCVSFECCLTKKESFVLIGNWGFFYEMSPMNDILLEQQGHQNTILRSKSTLMQESKLNEISHRRFLFSTTNVKCSPQNWNTSTDYHLWLCVNNGRWFERHTFRLRCRATGMGNQKIRYPKCTSHVGQLCGSNAGLNVCLLCFGSWIDLMPKVSNEWNRTFLVKKFKVADSKFLDKGFCVTLCPERELFWWFDYFFYFCHIGGAFSWRGCAAFSFYWVSGMPCCFFWIQVWKVCVETIIFSSWCLDLVGQNILEHHVRFSGVWATRSKIWGVVQLIKNIPKFSHVASVRGLWTQWIQRVFEVVIIGAILRLCVKKSEWYEQLALETGMSK